MKGNEAIGSDHPLISIGFPVYNGGKTIRHALDSLLGQNYKHFEIIVSDNASTDNTQEILNEYAALHPCIRVYFQRENTGILKNFQFVLDEARGDFFCWAAGDDWWDPRFLQTLKKALDAHPECGVSMSSYLRVDEGGEVQGEVLLSGDNDLNGISYHGVFQRMIGGKPIHVFIYGLFRAAFLKKVLQRPFPNCMAGDRVLMSEIALAAHFCCVREVLHHRTVHQLSLSERYGDEELGVLWKEKKRYFKYYWMMMERLVTSPHIPLGRKWRSLPMGWIRFMWKPVNKILRKIKWRIHHRQWLKKRKTQKR